ncbi:type I polyketide synthase [Saccharothrix syringae]|uniref:Type I polyketide synthase n=1 Tax=Saccharothrix syringae TaxID=103733 RepID=A0A5Q0H4X8_SACSY|nr:type I polyketide synthase [Saccharothrix syringae]QFZ20782.1 type I polyketide synthase [Saccharothrix syringae]
MSSNGAGPHRPIAVVGLGAVLPGSPGVDGFWRTVVAGLDHITEVPASHWLVEDHYDPDPAAPDKTYARRGAFLPPVTFDPLEFGLPPTDVPHTDVAQLLALVVARQALADALPGGPSAVDGERTGVVLGSSSLEMTGHMMGRLSRPVWLKVLRENGVGEALARRICDGIAANTIPWRETTFPGMLVNVVAGRVANHFDLHGLNHTVDAACASSLAALSTAVNELVLDRADLMIAGGVDTLNDIGTFVGFSKTPALSPTGDCRPFDADADGTMLGEGVVMFALKRLDDAERDEDRIYAVIRGVGASSDGRGTAIYAPVADGQVRSLRRAYAQAGYGPETVELVEAHGTGTQAGDRVELTALTEVFAASGRADGPWCALGSVKSQIGHTKAAAGAAGLLKAVLALHHKVLPPTIKVTRPNDLLAGGGSPFYANTSARPWLRPPDNPRRAAVSSFGFGGTNFHVTLEEYPGERRTRHRAAATELVLFSAASTEQLLGRLRAGAPGGAVSAVARESQRSFDPAHAVRLALLVTDRDDLADKSAEAATLIAQRPATAFSTPRGLHYSADEPVSGGVGFLFPGQGSQYAGMGADLAVHLPEAHAVWDELGRVRFDGTALADVAFPRPVFADGRRAGPPVALTSTEWAQPALAVHSLALLAVLTDHGVRPARVAGHSFGELTALCAAGVLAPGDLVRLARRRGELMRDASGADAGVMLAVNSGEAEVRRVIAAAGVTDVWPANLNAPDQTVVSGTAGAVAALERAFADEDVATRRLDTSAAFHSPLVAGAEGGLRAALADVAIGVPELPVHSGLDAAVHPDAPEEIRTRVARQLTAPVRFAAQVEAMYAAGTRVFVEVGPGNALTGLVTGTLGDRPHLAVPLDRQGVHGLAALQSALGRLAVNGVPVDFARHWRHHPPEVRTEPSAVAVEILGTNRGKPYPPPGGAAALPPPNPDEPPAATPAPRQPAIPSPAAPVGAVGPVDELAAQSAEAHATFQRLMTEAHLEYLRYSTAVRTGVATAPVTAPPVVAPPVVGPASTHVVEHPPVEPVTAPEPEPAAVARSSGALPDLEQALLTVVEERTGYPVSVLRPDMDLDADLGIDSIKRVEIFSGLRERAGIEIDLGTIDPARLGNPRTLRDVTEVFRGILAGALPADQDPAPDPGALPADARIADDPVTTGLKRFVPCLEAAAPSGLAVAGLGQARLLVVDGGSGVARPLVEQLRGRGIRATGSPDEPHDGVVFLGGLSEFASIDDALAVQREAFRLARDAAHHRVFVTVQDTGGDFGLSGAHGVRAWSGGLGALSVALGMELPGLSMKAIDCARADLDVAGLAARIADELTRGGGDEAVGLAADGSRGVATLEEVEPPAVGASRWERDSVVVVTGGGRGITSAATVALAEAGAGHLILLGRTALVPEPPGLDPAPDEQSLIRTLAAGGVEPAELGPRARAVLAVREVRATVEACARHGAQVEYLAVDVRDGRAVRRELDGVRARHGHITDLVHGAGAYVGKRIGSRTDEQYDLVFGTKVNGLRALLDALRDDPLRSICLFTSLSGYTGNTGLSDYSMANATLDHVAAVLRRERPGCATRALAWGPWDGGMVDDVVGRYLTGLGLGLISRADGTRSFVEEVGDPTGPVRVVLTNGSLPPGRGRRGEITLDDRVHPWLRDHCPADEPVLPLAAAVNWMIAVAGRPVLRDVKVLRKVTASGTRSLVASSQGPDVRLSDGDTHHFHARSADATPPGRWPLPPARESKPGDLLYDGGAMFHGPMFHALRSFTEPDAGDVTGVVVGLAELGWPRHDWHVDVAALDGMLQLGGVWAGRALGAVLAMGIGECRVHRAGPLGAPARGVVRPGVVRDVEAECDIALLDADGAVLVELLGARFVLRPGGGR